MLLPLPPTTPNADLDGPVIEIRGGGGTPIPPGGAVLVARGTAAQRLVEEAPVGTSSTLRLIFRPEWTGIAQAVGGGPVIVRDGGPVFRANEAFTSSQLAPRHPRTAVGQLADGRIVIVVADGRRPGYSVGMTNFELAQTLVRLGAVTASAFDGGGSSTLAFDGTLLNRPSDPAASARPRRRSSSCTTAPTSPAVLPVISPNGDGVDETQRPLSYKLVRPSTVTATLTAPGGAVAFTETGLKEPGHVPGRVPARCRSTRLRAARSARRRASGGSVVDATDDLGQSLETSAAVLGQQDARLRGALPAHARRCARAASSRSRPASR